MKNETANKAVTDPENQRIIVMGASTGGLEAFKRIIQELPPDFNIPIFIVWHMSPDVRSVLPHMLSKVNTIPAAYAQDKEEIKPRHIYIAPPDHHLLVEPGKVRVTHGPKENRFRPAIDPLFRSAAYSYGKQVIGVILSGALDDGTIGLWTVRHYGGIAVVQDPRDAEVPSMPENAKREVNIDYCVTVSELPGLLVRLAKEPLPEGDDTAKEEQTKREIDIATEESALKKGIMEFGKLTPFTCPECHGVLTRLQNDNIVHYRCHTGHAYSADTLITALTERIEDGLYNALRGMDESIMLLNHIGDHYADINQPRLAALYFRKAKEAEERSQLVRKAILSHEQINNGSLREQAGGKAK